MALVATAILSGFSASAAAQGAGEESSRCYGFAFGPWTPALDWRAAGHGAPPTPGTEQHAPAGRSWAFGGEPSAVSDTLLILVPSWWQAGVLVALPHPPRQSGDTIVTRATALVANGEKTPPVSRVRVWMVPCR